MKSFKNILFVSLIIIGFGCTDPISVDPGQGESQLVIDGLITYNPLDSTNLIKDTVKLSMTIDYNNQGSFPKINDASVYVSDNTGKTDTLLSIGNGNYITQKLLPKIGGIYQLKVILSNGEIYMANSLIRPLCKFDSLRAVDTVRTNGPGGTIPKGAYINLYAYDLPGDGDSYRFKTYVKRTPNANSPYYQARPDTDWHWYNQPRNLVSAADAVNSANSPNGIPDNTNTYTLFTLPIRVLVLNAVEENPRNYPAYYPGDSVKLEIYSITRDHLFFFYRLKQEATNGTGGGFSGLFARPIGNIPTNIVNSGPNSTKKALGWFGAAAVATKSIKIPENFSFEKSKSF